MSAGGDHHHVAVNTWAAGAPNATNDDARLLDWERVVPDSVAVQAAAASIVTAGFDVDQDGDVMVASDPWGIRLRLRSSS
jgi:catechol 2,3-dioxygenase